MMATKKMLGLVFLVMKIMVLLVGSCSAKTYKVGWSAKDDMYHSWAEGKEFHVGDSLVFNYDRNVNDVAQVSGALEYKLCDSSSPKAVYTTGQDVVHLTEPGHHYFITSNHGLCTLGQKLDVLVVHDRSHPTPPPPPSKSSQSPPPPPPSKSRPIPPPSSPSKSRPIPPPPPSKSRQSPPPPPPSRSRPTPPPPPSKARPIPPPPPPPSKSRPTPPPPPSKSSPTPPPPPPSKSPPPPPSSEILPAGKIYKVGNSRGWSVYNSFYYYMWSEGKEFYVGDSLYFQYNKDLNDVIEISDDLEFKSCEPTSRLAEYKTGHDLIKLTKPGVHYFISLKTGLCQAGLKLRVTVRPLPKAAVTSPNMRMSPIQRFNWWLRSFRPPHHP